MVCVFDRHNPDVPPGKCIVVGTEEGIHARAGRIENKVCCDAPQQQWGGQINCNTIPDDISTPLE